MMRWDINMPLELYLGKGNNMKIALCSDLHLEFETIELKNTENADVLILAGDICVASSLMPDNKCLEGTASDTYHKFFQQVTGEFKNVIYIAGNHEHYHGDFKNTTKELRKHLKYMDNLHILDNNTCHLDGVCFIGCTLWTDLNKEDPMTIENIKSLMNDFRIIKNSNNSKVACIPDNNEMLDECEVSRLLYPLLYNKVDSFTPKDSIKEHKKSLKFINNVYHDDDSVEKFVVVGHHAPSSLSISERYISDRDMNGGYYSDLSEFILDHPKITHWFHGHMHEKFSYKIGDTTIVCNPRGYSGHDKGADTFKLQFIEV